MVCRLPSCLRSRKIIQDSAEATDEVEPMALSDELSEPAPDEVTDPELLWMEPEPVAEPEIVAEPEVEPLLPTALVAVDSCLNLRPEPGIWSPSIDCLPPDTRVRILGRDGEWTRIGLDYGDQGWVASSYLVPLTAEDASAADGESEVEIQLRELREELEQLRASQSDSRVQR